MSRSDRPSLLGPDLPDWFVDRIDELRRYVERRGWSSVNSGTVLDGIKLVKFLNWMRGRYNQGQLSYEAVLALESVPGFSWSPAADRTFRSRAYHLRFVERFRRFLSRHGLDELRPDVVEDGANLGRWWRSIYGRFVQGSLPEWLIQALEAVPGHEWAARTIVSQAEERAMLAALRRVVERDGWRSIRPDIRVGGMSLRSWVMHCRGRALEEKLPEWLAIELEKIEGWTATPTLDRHRLHLDKLKRAVRDGGWSAVREEKTARGNTLTSWVKRRRREYRNGTLVNWLAVELARIPGWEWRPRGNRKRTDHTRILRQAASFRCYVERHGWVDISKTSQFEGVRLYGWAQRLRRKHREGGLPDEVQRAIEAIPGWSWDQSLGKATGMRGRSRERWRKLETLERLAARVGWENLPASTKIRGQQLSTFLAELRAARRIGRLPSDLVERMERLPGFSWLRWASVTQTGRG